MPFEIIRSDITALHTKVDAIVNTANPRPIIGNGTDRAIHLAAGPELLAARKGIGNIERGHSAITPAFNLNANYVIHSVGPHWQGGSCHETEILRNAYDSALSLAIENGCQSIAFPLMAAGSYGFPKDKALSIANQAIGDFLLEHELLVYLVVFNTEAFRLSKHLQKDIQAFIDDYYVADASEAEYHYNRNEYSRQRWEEELLLESRCDSSISDLVLPSTAIGQAKLNKPKKSFSDLFSECSGIDELLNRNKETFSEALIRIIDEHGWKDSEVYKRAGMDKKLFNKIINSKDYHPTKTNALLLAVALQLNLDETKDFIAKAGYVLTETSDFDLIVAYFISKKQYDYITINEVLFARGLGLLSKGY